MCSKSAAAVAEIAARFGYSPGRNSKWLRLCRDVEYTQHLTVLKTLVRGSLPDNSEEVTARLRAIRGSVVIMVDACSGRGTGAQFLLGELGELHTQYRKSRVGADVGW